MAARIHNAFAEIAERTMSRLYDAVRKVDDLIKSTGKEGKAFFHAKGQISMQAGFVLSAIRETSADNANQLAALKAAVKAVLGKDL